ncbi:hypothetical protein ACPV3A_32670 [Paenibacillus sp. Dod16]|uniref:hypothetical protein n=1 Tax=Paenibacillus sp. Dod16 TaxID=3416392 RepID=UPI003CF5EFB3
MEKIMITLIAVCFILTGCFSIQTENQSNLKKENESIPSERENKLILELVTATLQAAGIEMFEEKLENDWVLNNVMPNRFSVSRPDVKEAYKEYISIYVYKSEKARIEGFNDFNKQKEKYDMSIPNIYQHKNVLLLYWYNETVDNAENAKFNKQIEMAIQKM